MHYRYHLSLVSFTLLFFSFSLLSQGGYVFDHVNINIEINKDGSFTVIESLEVDFSESRRGIIRSIPYRYEKNGERIDVSFSNIEVDGDKFKLSRSRGEQIIRIGDADRYITGKKEYKVSYHVQGAISSYEDHDEFFWNLITPNSDATVTKSSFSISFPEDWIDSISEYRAFSGAKGSQGQNIVLHKEGRTLIGASRTELPSGHGVSFAIKIPKGLIERQGRSTPQTNEAPQISWVFRWWNVIPMGLAAFLLGFWRKFEKSSIDEEEVLDQYYPPDGMSSGEVGTFYDHKANRRDIISLLPYWGNQGLVKMKPVDGSDGDIYFYKLKDIPLDRPPYQHTLFNGLFKDGDVVLLSDLKEKFYKTIRATAGQLKKEIKDKALYDERSKDVFHSGWLIALGIISILGGIFVIIFSHAVVAGIGLFIVGVGSFVLHAKPPKLSDLGASHKQHLKGFYSFLKNPDPDKIEELIQKDPDYLHKVYPYVLAFDLDQSWTSFQKEHSLDYTPPIWFDGYHSSDNTPFNYGQVSESFDVRQIEQVFYSAPPPPSNDGGSIGGGFSGGGSVGGGFGGGSTSSW